VDTTVEQLVHSIQDDLILRLKDLLGQFYLLGCELTQWISKILGTWIHALGKCRAGAWLLF
jgi:hypothetical protein